MCVAFVLFPVCGASCLQRTGLGYPDATGLPRIVRLCDRSQMTSHVSNTSALPLAVGNLNGDNTVSIEEKVIGIVSDQLDSPKDEISRASSFVDDLKADMERGLNALR